MAEFVRAVLLVAAGVALGTAANSMSPRPAPLRRPVFPAADAPGATCQESGIARISVQDAKPLCIACTAAFVDARSAQEYAAGHVTGAVHLPPGESVDSLVGRLGEAPTVIVYDRDRQCAAADQVATALKARGVRDVRVLTGAWSDWVAAGGPGESGACALCTAGAR
jgi:3-mercaptopyruvate sulfurtransferase SseA